MKIAKLEPECFDVHGGAYLDFEGNRMKPEEQIAWKHYSVDQTLASMFSHAHNYLVFLSLGNVCR